MGYEIDEIPFKLKDPGLNIRLFDFGLKFEEGAPGDQGQVGIWLPVYVKEEGLFCHKCQ